MPRSAILCLVLGLYLGPTTAALAMPTLVRTSQYSPARKRAAKRPRTNAFASPARKPAAPPCRAATPPHSRSNDNAARLAMLCSRTRMGANPQQAILESASHLRSIRCPRLGSYLQPPTIQARKERAYSSKREPFNQH